MSNKPKIAVEQRFGELVVKARVGTKIYKTSHVPIWLVECDCGNRKEVLSSSLHSRRTRSCGCLRVKRLALPAGRAARNEIFRKYRVQAAERGFLWEVTEKEFDRLTSENCHYCGLSPSNIKRLPSGDFTYSGIDRMDNSHGYEIGNVVGCCIDCNRLKGRMDYNKFVAWLDRVSQHRTKLTMKTTIGM
jgi:hypothetical protein